MKPEQWVVDDIKSLRVITSRSPAQDAYLSLLTWYTRLMQGKDK